MTRVEINQNGMYDLRRAPGVRAELERRGRQIMARANAELGEQGYGMDSHQGAKRPYGRWRVTVYTKSTYAKRHDRKHNTLIRLLGSG